MSCKCENASAGAAPACASARAAAAADAGSRSCSCTTCTCSCPVTLPAADNPCLSDPCNTAENIAAINASYYPAPGTDCAPIMLEADSESVRQRERCTDPNGCTGLYPAECRDGFWPAFAHPRWLCCADLYAGQPV